MNSKDIQKQIRQLKQEMKAEGVRRISCFNGGLSSQEYTYNARLFQLSVDLDKAKTREAK